MELKIIALSVVISILLFSAVIEIDTTYAQETLFEEWLIGRSYDQTDSSDFAFFVLMRGISPLLS
jgi:hypothetical protein